MTMTGADADGALVRGRGVGFGAVVVGVAARGRGDADAVITGFGVDRAVVGSGEMLDGSDMPAVR
ncbi:MAG: hypothetical protein ACR2LX_06475 [Jatrophihabitans sp.]